MFRFPPAHLRAPETKHYERSAFVHVATAPPLLMTSHPYLSLSASLPTSPLRNRRKHEAQS